MKDSNDKQTLDLLDKPRRGRPVTGKAKTQAQIQREYRQRKKQKSSFFEEDSFLYTITLTRHELSYVLYGLDREFKGLSAIGHIGASHVDRLRSFIRVLIQDKTKTGIRTAICPGAQAHLDSERLPFLKRIDHFED